MTTKHTNRPKDLLTCTLAFLCILTSFSTFSQIKRYEVKPYEKVIISPHIQVVFKATDDRESVVIESIDVSVDKLNVEVKGKTLRLYLDDAKTITKTENIDEDGSMKRDIYQGTIVEATVYYKNIESISLRGEEDFSFPDLIQCPELDLKIYGESQVQINHIETETINATLYGESSLSVQNGNIDFQYLTSYGESKIDLSRVSCQETNIVVFGEGTIICDVKEHLKITTLGEPEVRYSGNPTISKGIVIGAPKLIKVSKQGS